MTRYPPSSSQDRGLWWYRFVEREGLIRHPVSLSRQRVGWLLLALMFAAWGWYAFTTRDEGIRKRAVAFLESATGGEVSVGAAHFAMFGGITLNNVSVSVPFDSDLDPNANDPADRRIFTAGKVTLVHNPWRLLLGSLRVDEIIATQPTITLAQNAETGLRNWQLLSGIKEPGRKGGKPPRPRITLRQARAEVVSIDASGKSKPEYEDLDVDVQPHPQSPTGYYIEIRRYSEPAERTTVVFDPGRSLVSNTPFVDARTVKLQLPKQAQEFFEQILLSGEVKLSRLIYDAKTPEERETQIELRDVECRIPLSMLRGGDEKVGSAVQAAPGEQDEIIVVVSGARGALSLDGERLTLDVSGLINGAACHFEGTLEGIGGDLAALGLDVHIRGTDVPAPEGALREQLASNVQTPKLIRDILNDYDPRGAFDIDFRLQRARGSDAKMMFSGVLEPQNASGSPKEFPYRVTDVTGRLRFEPGLVHLESLIGRHGSASVHVTGKINRERRWPGADVTIDGTTVPFDTALYAALSDHHQQVWQRFNPVGTSRVRVTLHRPGGDADEPEPHWQTHVSAELNDTRIVFDAFPYPLRGVNGTLDIEGDCLRFDGITGHHGDASVRVDGYVMFEGGEPEVELRVEASGMALDETLAKALPPEARGAFAQFQPEGSVDLLGRVSVAGGGSGMVYDLRAIVRDASICYRAFPYAIHDVNGEILIRPDEITVVNVTGRHGEGEVTARGGVRRLEDGHAADLVFDWKRLPLDSDLSASLPPSLKQVWTTLKPGGQIGLKMMLHHESRNGKSWYRHNSEVEAAGTTVCFAGFPLPMTFNSGRAIIRDESIEFVSLKGTTAYGGIEINGEIDATPPGRRGTLAVRASELRLTSKLMEALPAALRDAFKAVKIRGNFDVALDPVRFDTDGEGRTQWVFAGQTTLKDASADLGFEVREGNGTIDGHGEIDREGKMVFFSRAALDRIRLAGWPLEHVSAEVVYDPDEGMVRVSRGIGHVYGGEVAGSAEIEPGDDHTDYQASITARDLMIERYLEATRPGERRGEGNEATAKGLVFGNMILRGRSGANRRREAAGEVFVREAQVWRLPLGFALFQMLNLTPDENVFHDGWIKYYVSQNTLTFQHIDLQGSAVAFVGGGRMDLPSKRLDVTLLAGSPVRIRVPFLTEILEGAAREVMEVKVRGTLDKPDIQPQPLKGLTTVLKTLFPEPPERAWHQINRPSGTQ